ncbi:MAG: chorismate synthase [Clostridia bacterium]|nr:chorismate synthase [Clostridia bacterium]
MGSSFGKNISLSIFGESHGPSIGLVLEGLPAGFRPDWRLVDAFLQRRAPGRGELATPRREADSIEILSGVKEGVLCGTPFAAIIRNTNVRREDYQRLNDIPRPGHSDYTSWVKYGPAAERSGGGHASGRLTAPLCLAGALCLQILAEQGIAVGSHIERIGQAEDRRFSPLQVNPADFAALLSRPLPVLDEAAGDEMAWQIAAAAAAGDSLGGVVECAVTGLPAGLGDPIFDGMENRISQLIFAIPAVKGVEFGNGFAAAGLTGSANNDDFIIAAGQIRTAANRHGGILGGITSGMPLIFRAAFKPTPSIAKEQGSVSLSRREQVRLQVEGRHDPCIVPRALPCVEAAAAIAVYDAWLEQKKYL